MDAASLRRYLDNASLPNACREQLMVWMEAKETNDTDSTQSHDGQCADSIPTSAELFRVMSTPGYILIGFLTLSTFLTLANYAEEIHFIMTHFRKETRRRKTIWILAFFPTFSVTGLLGVLVPRSGTLVDMTANVFFGTCLYNFGRLMTDYMGGPKRMWQLIADRKMSLNTPPCCCCCVCLPEVKFKPKVFLKLSLQVMQVAIVRPILMFFAAVLWANGSYHPGNMSLYNGYLYVTVLNLISTVVAVYGLMLTRGVLRPELEQQFRITGKILSLQLTLLCSAVPNLIISILVSSEVIQCSSIFPSKARGEEIYHSFLVLMMLPFSLLGRRFYRRLQDGDGVAQPQGQQSEQLESKGQIVHEKELEAMTQQLPSINAESRDNGDE